MSSIVEFTKNDLLNEAKTLIEGYPKLSSDSFIEKTMSVAERIEEEDIRNIFILHSLERITVEEPDWTYIAAAFHLRSLYCSSLNNRSESSVYGKGSFYRLLQKLTEEGIYTPKLLQSYSQKEIEQAAALIVPSRDSLFTYIGLRTLADRYLATDHNKNPYELPQERFLVIALTLMMNEPKDQRADLIAEAYWALSNLYMTVATPTLSNAGKSYGQLSSCFIDTVDDSLRGIYDSNTDVATVSKNGGGIGAYLGKIRSRGSDIKGFKGNSSGVLPWMKQLNNTAVSVDQLGQRQGAVAVYLDVWHKDVFEFLDAKLNNGDERMRTHDLFTGLCIPDIFMEAVEERADWHLFDPHEVRQVMGFSLEDVYDKEKGAGEFRVKYAQCVNHPELSRKTVPAIEIMKRVMKSQLETGTPYMFYRDTVNRANPNKHAGMIYASNLCTEIMQNMSATTVEEEITKDGKIIITKTPGDYVVCNLSSINLGRAVTADVLERLIPIQVRMLDNVIDINTIEVPQAQFTNEKYRSIGLGTFGWHHLLAKKGIVWESHEAANYADELYETINYLTIQASNELAVEKGSYSLFEGSDWQNGEYFHQRGYSSEKWKSLKEKVQVDGVRNAYLLAVAPNSSTSLIAGSTASIDPIFQKEYSEEKKNYKIPVTAPDLSPETTWYYKSAYHIDQLWSIEQNAARQRHIDQSISFNIYVQSTVKAKDLLHIHMTAWRKGLKTTYYTRSTSVDIEDCESCAS
ncbi:ribonucleoside-diphosphate reductase subunit alpha [Pseudalkalibacillus hwajinpoensis]|uniref:Ribonucleoside-diphosphate reductase n=1 Tax=Guptibacillus hwajinpoensis TaxID=208199 RepID=A0A4U1MGA5_9BACL|nr:ribonucleoside-diphosphate reductase subunit alpha [Pseudalkalibacillus hwajinpoensis]TKD69374.1 ribonucleoside-diphosphate reductase subunit alpha [Pseudalkalibacillus hwajinpoensis]